MVASQLVCCTLFALKMAPVKGQNVRSVVLTSCLAVIFELMKLLSYWTMVENCRIISKPSRDITYDYVIKQNLLTITR